MLSECFYCAYIRGGNPRLVLFAEREAVDAITVQLCVVSDRLVFHGHIAAVHVVLCRRPTEATEVSWCEARVRGVPGCLGKMELVSFTDEQLVYDLHIDGLEAMQLEKKKKTKEKAEDPVGQMWASAIAGLSDQQAQAAGKQRQATKQAPAKVKYVKPDVDDRGHADSASDIPSSRPSDSGEDSPGGGADGASSGVGPPPAAASSSVAPKAPPPPGLPPPTSPLLAPPAVLAPPLPSPDIGVGPIDHDDVPLSVLLDIAYSGCASSASGAGASSSRAPADGSGGAAVDLDEAVAPADVSRRGRGWGHGGRGVPHRVWDADIRGDGLAQMKYEESTFQITVRGNLPSHGRLCRLRRSVLPGKNLAQGRPGGFLLA